MRGNNTGRGAETQGGVLPPPPEYDTVLSYIFHKVVKMSKRVTIWGVLPVGAERIQTRPHSLRLFFRFTLHEASSPSWDRRLGR